MADHFDERSGVIPVVTKWGRWWQTLGEIFIEVSIPLGTTPKDILCTIKNNSISLKVRDSLIFQGNFPTVVHADESIWTIEDSKLLLIVLPKSDTSAGNCWTSLLIGQFNADSWTHDQMQRKMTLNRFQNENPGFDFSGASITGNYQGGGPQFS